MGADSEKEGPGDDSAGGCESENVSCGFGVAVGGSCSVTKAGVQQCDHKLLQPRTPGFQPLTPGQSLCFGLPDGISLCHPGWSAMARSWLTATSASWVQAILLNLPTWRGKLSDQTFLPQFKDPEPLGVSSPRVRTAILPDLRSYLQGHFSGDCRPARTEMVPGLPAVCVRSCRRSGRSAQLFASTSLRPAVEVVGERAPLVLGFDLRQQRAALDRELAGDGPGRLLPALGRSALGDRAGIGRPFGWGLLGGSPRAAGEWSRHGLEGAAPALPLGGGRGRGRLFAPV
ncbi:putative uncharacterized protein SPANXA2-OT1 [Plecturocebus cupreus]